MTRRTIEALRALAERPGTEAEGVLARELLARHEQNVPVDHLEQYRTFLRTGNIDDLRAAVGKQTCQCGSLYDAFTACQNQAEHDRILREGFERFPHGTTVYYNYWAYPENCRGFISEARGHRAPWYWRRIKFDHLKNSRVVPVYSVLGWHISNTPLSLEQRGDLRGGMDKIGRGFDA